MRQEYTNPQHVHNTQVQLVKDSILLEGLLKTATKKTPEIKRLQNNIEVGIEYLESQNAMY